MPNLNLIASLRERFDETNPQKYSEVKAFVESENVKKLSFKNQFNKSFSNQAILEFKNFSFSKPDLIKYFEEKHKEHVCVLFIDITGFSQKFSNLNSSEITNLLDDYYKKLIPIIYKYGGEIEKIIGDGIIAVFGPPFSDVSKVDFCLNAEKCGAESIKKFKKTNIEIKVALHYGEVMYYKYNSLDYEEYTMLGNTLTELFRLESVSQVNSINFFDETLYRSMCIVGFTPLSQEKNGWVYSHNTYNLQGLGIKKINNFYLP